MFDIHYFWSGSKELQSLVDYTNRREFGRTAGHEHQRLSDRLTAQRCAKALIADTPVNCRSVYLLRLNCSGELVAAAHGDRSVCIYCVSNGRLLLRCTGHERSPWTLTFHPTQPYLLASGCLGGSVRLWNLDYLAKVGDDKNERVTEMSSVCVWKQTGAIASLSFHPVHSILVAAWTQEVVFYDWVSGRMLSVWRFVSNHSRVRWVKFAPDGTVLYTATANPSSGEPTYVHKSPNKSVFSSPTKVEHTKTSGKALMGIGNTSDTTKNMFDTLVPRDALLEYLAKCTDSWFQNLGICSVCSVRLCRWAGTLGPKFPAVTTDIRLGISVAQQAAAAVAATTQPSMFPSHVRELLNLANPNHCSEVFERLCRDANPAAVAIIEDMPVREFLLSRGNYCEFPNVAVPNGGICCGGHACDLVITHRELMRHSLCRPCLSSFWHWASKHVAWWRWSFPSSAEQPLNSTSTDSNKMRTSQSMKSGTFKKSADVMPPVGICIRCRAKMSMQLQLPSNVLSSHSPPNTSSHGISLVPFESSNCTVSSLSEMPSKSHLLVPLAALDLLRSRLSNAHEVTPITYVATDLINDYLLSQHIKNLLNTSVHSAEGLRNSKISCSEVEHNTVCVSSASKRRKVDGRPTHIQFLLNHSGEYSSLNNHLNLRLLDSDSDATCKLLESNNLPSTSEASEPCLPQEASDFGTYIRDNPDNNWNHPCPVTVNRASSISSRTPSLIFPYVQTGASLLRSPRHFTSSSSKVVLTNYGLRASTSICDTDYDEANDRSSMTACCRCGHIVLQTFPVDPHSNMSAVVCEKLVCSENQCMSTGSLTNRSGTIYSQFSADSGISSATPSHQSSLQSNVSFSLPHSFGPAPLSNYCRRVQAGMSESATRSLSGTFNLTDNTGTILNAVNRSITEVITGLFVDMGEYGSASSLQDVTYRICRWELSLCSPTHSISQGYTVSGRNHEAFGEYDGTDAACLPMPTNVAVSYNNNSLVVPHAHGRLLAAFVIPQETSHCALQSSQSSSTVLRTLLAVYRLQPEHNRGQCLFAHNFTSMSPVCLDFSPLGDYLAVGFATTRIPSESYPSMRQSTTNRDLISYGDSVSVSESQSPVQSSSKCSCQKQTSVACVFHLQRSKTHENGHVRRCLRDIRNIKHPALSEPMSSRYFENSNTSEKLDRWHRLLLSAPNGLSLNTIVWNANGSILYGTTKGLIVISHAHRFSRFIFKSSYEDIIDYPHIMDTQQSI
ncbi:unnamed protein product [Heterobilharzia americana]|nr:unnamed protein product [Heterobilharzia americana]